MTLTAENLGKRFNREWIFRNLNYTFQNEVYAITGPNGSGKSTLLQVLWGQSLPSAGTLTYRENGHDVPAEDAYKNVVIAAPYADLLEELTLDEIFRFHFSFKSVRDNQPLGELMDRLELTHARGKMISQLSSGMKQRLKLGLAFYSEANLVFLDEPTSNLDKKSIDWYWQNLTPLLGKCGIFIASNLENDYPSQSKKIHLPDLK